MPRILQKVFGRWWWVGGLWWWLTMNLVFCFGPKLWFWTWTKLNNKSDPWKIWIENSWKIKHWIKYQFFMHFCVKIKAIFIFLKKKSGHIKLSVKAVVLKLNNSWIRFVPNELILLVWLRYVFLVIFLLIVYAFTFLTILMARYLHNALLYRVSQKTGSHCFVQFIIFVTIQNESWD